MAKVQSLGCCIGSSFARHAIAWLVVLIPNVLLSPFSQAAPSLLVTSSYNASLGVIQWDVTITQDTSGALAVELPFQLGPADAGNGFLPTLEGSTGNANTADNTTYYYNETSAGSGVLVWNTQQDVADKEQNAGKNPFTGTDTEGLWIDAPNLVIFAALGSDVNLPDPVPTLHIASSDGRLEWTDARTTEAGNTFMCSGELSSVMLGDLNGDGSYDRSDVEVLRDALSDFANYQASFPGLDGVARGDANVSSSLNVADLVLVAPDFDHNYVLDAGDLASWETSFAINNDADADGNGFSDGGDFLLWQQQQGQSFGPAPAGLSRPAMPEPASLLLASLVGCALWRAGVRRRPLTEGGR